jgi:hypothetical protein
MDALSIAPDGFPWWACTAACPHLIRTVPEVPWEEVDGHRGEVEDEKSENHAYEDVGRFFEARPHAPRTEAIDPLSHLNDDPISKRHQEEIAKKHAPAYAARRCGFATGCRTQTRMRRAKRSTSAGRACSRSRFARILMRHQPRPPLGDARIWRLRKRSSARTERDVRVVM